MCLGLAVRREDRRLPAVKRPALLRRRSIWLPTVWGGLAGLVLVGALGLGVFELLLPRVYPFLACEAPIGGELLVVEGWMGPDELRAVAPLVRTQGYRRIVTTGGRIPDWADRLGAASYAELARQFLVEQGLEPERVIALPAPDSAQDRTYLSAVRVRDWALEQVPPPRTLDVVSSGAHARRTWRLFALAFGEQAAVGIRSLRSPDFDPAVWWRSSAGARTVLAESIGWLWSVLFFHPPEPGSDEELWGDAEAIARWRAMQAERDAVPAEP